MKNRHQPWRILATVASATAILLAAGCSDNSSDEPESVSLEPLTEVASPETATAPSGSVVVSPTGLHSITFDAAARSVVALGDDATTLLVFDADNLEAAPRSISLPEPAAAVTAVGDGSVLLPMNGDLGHVDLGSATVTTSPVDGALLSAAVLSDGRFAAGDDTGVVHVLDPDGDNPESAPVTIDGLSSVDALASTEHGLAALDRHQTSLTQVDTQDESLGLALRAGTGAARLTTDTFGRILVTDAAGSELLVYSSDDLLLRQRFPVGAQPWGVAYDGKSGVVWVTTPADNEVVGYTLDTGIPVEAGRFSTVRQPDSIAVDAETGDLFVGSASGDGLQRIPTGGAN